MPRFEHRRVRISNICLSWNSTWAFRVTVLSTNSKVAPVSLKSKRCVSSRIAWSTALVSSCLLSSETTSNEGIVSSALLVGGLPGLRLELLAVLARELHEPGRGAYVFVHRIALLIRRNHLLTRHVGHRRRNLLQRHPQQIRDQLLSRPSREHLRQRL